SYRPSLHDALPICLAFGQSGGSPSSGRQGPLVGTVFGSVPVVFDFVRNQPPVYGSPFDPSASVRHSVSERFAQGRDDRGRDHGGVSYPLFSAPSNPPFPGAGCGGSRRPFHRHRLFDHFSKLGKANRSALGYNHRGGGKGSSDSPIPPPAPFRHSVLVVAWSKPFASRGTLRMGVPGGRDRSSDHILF